MDKKKQRSIGLISIAFAIGVQLFNDFACYNKTLWESITFLWFPGLVLIPAVVFLFSAKPIRALGASLTAAGFYGVAYYTDCVLPYLGGGASMVYVVVIMGGTPVAIAVGFLVGWLFDVKRNNQNLDG